MAPGGTISFRLVIVVSSSLRRRRLVVVVIIIVAVVVLSSHRRCVVVVVTSSSCLVVVVASPSPRHLVVIVASSLRRRCVVISSFLSARSLRHSFSWWPFYAWLLADAWRVDASQLLRWVPHFPTCHRLQPHQESAWVSTSVGLVVLFGFESFKTGSQF